MKTSLNADRRDAARFPAPAERLTDEPAAIFASLIAGTIYLAAQMLASSLVLQGSALDTLLRIAALLLGPDQAPPSAEISGVAVGMGVLVHLLLSLAFGCFIASTVERFGLGFPLRLGAVMGLCLYLLDYALIAPHAFPWLLQSESVLTAINHVAFGAVVAVAYVRLRQAKQAPPGRT